MSDKNTTKSTEIKQPVQIDPTKVIQVQTDALKKGIDSVPMTRENIDLKK